MPRDQFKGWPPVQIAPGRKLKAVTPDDANDLPAVPKALYVTVTGNLKVTAVDGNEDAAGADLGPVTFAVTAGQIFDFVIVGRVWATGTTATVLAAVG
jgi:hypothetical protein